MLQKTQHKLRGTTRLTVEGCRLNVASQLSLEFKITDEAVADYFAESSTFNLFHQQNLSCEGQASSVCIFVLPIGTGAGLPPRSPNSLTG